MCKSQAEGGQRCAGHALEAVTAANNALREATEAFESDDISSAHLEHFEDAAHKAQIAYASTLDGAAKYRADLAAEEAARDRGTDPHDAAAIAELRALIDAGAKQAQVNREVENAYRATQGKPPLTTPLPQTLAEEQAAADQSAAEAEAKAAWAADPFGLRATNPAAHEVLSKHREPVIPDAATIQSILASHAHVAQTIASQTGGGDLTSTAATPEPTPRPLAPAFPYAVDALTYGEWIRTPEGHERLIVTTPQIERDSNGNSHVTFNTEEPDGSYRAHREASGTTVDVILDSNRADQRLRDLNDTLTQAAAAEELAYRNRNHAGGAILFTSRRIAAADKALKVAEDNHRAAQAAVADHRERDDIARGRCTRCHGEGVVVYGGMNRSGWGDTYTAPCSCQSA